MQFATMICKYVNKICVKYNQKEIFEGVTLIYQSDGNVRGSKPIFSPKNSIILLLLMSNQRFVA